jgi:transposase-like protein
MEGSNCVVNVVIPKTGTIRRYNIPTDNSTNGNLWEVFELNVGTGSTVSVTDINQFKKVSETGEDVK